MRRFTIVKGELLMRTRVFGVLLATAVAAAGSACSDAPSATQPAAISVPLQVQTDAQAGAQGATPDNHRTHLTGDNERPVPNESKGQGQAIFQVNAEGTEIQFKLIASNIENVTQAHIHCCANSEATAGIVVWLYPSAPPLRLIPGRSDGVLAEGVIRQSSLVGGLAGQPLSTLLARIESGLAYVNVHTSQFPPGEIRGQIR